jgi:hypothetical protein
LHERARTTPDLVRALESSGATMAYERDGFQLLALRP